MRLRFISRRELLKIISSEVEREETKLEDNPVYIKRLQQIAPAKFHLRIVIANELIIREIIFSATLSKSTRYTGCRGYTPLSPF